MPIAIDSYLSESAVLSETANRHMPSDMPGPLTDKPDGTTQHVHVANTCLLAVGLSSKMPIFITGVRDIRSFLTCLRAS